MNITRTVDLEVSAGRAPASPVHWLHLVVTGDCERLIDEVGHSVFDQAHRLTSGVVLTKREGDVPREINAALAPADRAVVFCARFHQPGFCSVETATIRIVSASAPVANLASSRLFDIAEDLTALRVIHKYHPKNQPVEAA